MAPLKKIVKAARRGYQKWASNPQTIKTTRMAEKIILDAAKSSGNKELAHMAGLGVGGVKAVAGHNVRTRKAGMQQAVKHAIPLAVSAAKMAATGASATSTAPSASSATR